MTTKVMIDRIRQLISQNTDSEKECLEALCDEASTWEMRLDELCDEETRDDE